VLDYGLTTQLTKVDRQNLILLFKAVIDKDGREVGRLMIEKSRIQQQVIDAEGFQEAMQEVSFVLTPPSLSLPDVPHRSLTMLSVMGSSSGTVA
jgi:predicted unusual protein kinase regulating ubiquinone biosynthesis (AarF/ABC1/UbiB family)